MSDDIELSPGTLAWGKVESHPWWPGVVCREPGVNQFKKTNNKGTFYNMQFLSQPPSRGWVKDRNIKPFKGVNVSECKKGGTFFSNKKSFKEALEEADLIHTMTSKKRLAHIDMLDEDHESGRLEKKEKQTFIIGKTKIPSTWQTPYVLMSTNDIPEDLTVVDFVKVPDTGKKKSPNKEKGNSQKKAAKRKKEDSDEEIEEEEEDDEEEEELSEEEKPIKKGGSKKTAKVTEKKPKEPPKKKTKKMSPKKKVEEEEIEEEEEEEVEEEFDAGDDDDDDDDDWKEEEKSIKKGGSKKTAKVTEKKPKEPPKKKKKMSPKKVVDEEEIEEEEEVEEEFDAGDDDEEEDWKEEPPKKKTKKMSPKKVVEEEEIEEEEEVEEEFDAVDDDDEEDWKEEENSIKKGGSKKTAKVKESKPKEPPKKKTKKMSPKKVVEEEEIEEEDEEVEEEFDAVDDDGEEDWKEDMEETSETDVSLSDSDDDWAPKKKKGSTKMTKIKTKTKTYAEKIRDLKLKNKLTAESIPVNKPIPPKPSVSLTTYLPPKLIEDQSTEGPSTAPSVSVTPPVALKPLIINSMESTGPEPEVGDFLIEKAECKDGKVHFIWRFKKGGLIQKYEKTTEKDQTFYQNILCFSDWWPCYAHKYQKVETKLLFKYKNVEKVLLMEEPVLAPEADKDTSKTEEKETDSSTPITESSTPTTDDKENAPAEKPAEKSAENATETPADKTSKKSADNGENSTQEQEVSSTTDDNFQIGHFVLDKKDERNPDAFPVWKIESSILLRKFEPIVKRGKLYHKPLKTYRGYKEKDIGKFYNGIKVIKRPTLGSDLIEVAEESRPKVVVDSTTEKEFDQHPLLQHFYVYLQAFLSQALEEGFLSEILETKDESFTFPMGEINKIISQKIVNIERKVRWTNKIKKAMQKSPYLREVYKPDPKRNCEAVGETTDSVEQNVFLFGPEYDDTTIEKSSKVNACEEFRVGSTAINHISTYHKLCHFKFNLFEKCNAKIKLVRESKEDADVTEVMDACLGNKAWVLQNFEDFMNLVELNPC